MVVLGGIDFLRNKSNAVVYFLSPFICLRFLWREKKKKNQRLKKKKGKKIKSPVYLTSRFTLVYASCRNV